MWIYEKKLQYPVKIKNPNPRLAQIIISQLGGPDGEIGASMRYLHQRYSMPEKQVAGLLTDIGTEELAPRGYRESGEMRRGGRWGRADYEPPGVVFRAGWSGGK